MKSVLRRFWSSLPPAAIPLRPSQLREVMNRTTAILLLLAAAGCAALRANSGGEASYFPMSADRSWHYRLRLHNGEIWPVIVHSRGPRFVPELGRVAAIFDEDYPDQKLPVAYFLSEGFLQSEIGLRYRLERGVEVMPIGIQPMRVMPMPPRVGMRWAYFEQVFGTSDGAAFDIRWSGSVSRAESVVVPAGTFHDCLRIESIALHRIPLDDHPHEFRYVDWYAPNVGLVKNEYTSGSRDVVTHMELVGYGPGEPSPAADPSLVLAAR